MRALFVADLHLAEERPEATAALLAFLAGPARKAEALYILGDLFEYWAGDDDGDAPLNRRIADTLRALAQGGTPVHFMAGNRDFLLGEAYAAQAGMALLPDPFPLVLGKTRMLLSHGDILCTDDLPYQAYRRQVRDPAWQAAFLARPLAERKAFIEDLRRRSEVGKREKAMAIMDVNRAAVEALLREHGYPTLIHGHTHRPACHEHLVDGHACQRWVLADWHATARYLAFDGECFRTGELAV
ncbi:UDP-2,3-diacylglucosamine diphosphatase [Pseudothauera rhizosphaerae]|uniref:UDP-2,3-diacylglucosamine hydrolase n=1 Tax=Pseudothauera rhizosphaerae TaxID=2565932 RepID=A0A4S4AS25_9RHOO|nr:UDP-2,3-diacylglucosamine diphosphatase [Pseudothauera rhizosphaerae]THF62508.1 UDP-2,3-diacylglucosamine diphosphatase [Pseudothauera rhizosphaerae]